MSETSAVLFLSSIEIPDEGHERCNTTSLNLACDHSFDRGGDRAHLLSDDLHQVLGIITTDQAKMASAVVIESPRTLGTRCDDDRPSRPPSQSPANLRE